jgi:hypothetical protein
LIALFQRRNQNLIIYKMKESTLSKSKQEKLLLLLEFETTDEERYGRRPTDVFNQVAYEKQHQELFCYMLENYLLSEQTIEEKKQSYFPERLTDLRELVIDNFLMMINKQRSST